MIPSSVEDLIAVGDQSVIIFARAITRFLRAITISYGIHFICRLVVSNNFTPSTYVLVRCIIAIDFISMPYLWRLIVRSCLLLVGGMILRPMLIEVFLLIEWMWYVTTYIVTTAVLLGYRGGLENLKKNGLGVAWRTGGRFITLAGFIGICLRLSGDTRAEVRGESTVFFAMRISAASLASGGYTVCWLAFRLVQFSQAWAESLTKRHVGALSNVASGREYRYSALDSAQKIRLLRLRKATPFSRMTCTLTVTPLNSAPSFEAVSYTWAGQVADHYITLEDGCWLTVTENAFNIIHERASFLKPRYVWLDAICINQSDPNEKQSQVEMMGQIYGTASRVLAWLGNRHSNG